jgi:hypothetical protein
VYSAPDCITDSCVASYDYVEAYYAATPFAVNNYYAIYEQPEYKYTNYITSDQAAASYSYGYNYSDYYTYNTNVSPNYSDESYYNSYFSNTPDYSDQPIDSSGYSGSYYYKTYSYQCVCISTSSTETRESSTGGGSEVYGTSSPSEGIARAIITNPVATGSSSEGYSTANTFHAEYSTSSESYISTDKSTTQEIYVLIATIVII